MSKRNTTRSPGLRRKLPAKKEEQEPEKKEKPVKEKTERAPARAAKKKKTARAKKTTATRKKPASRAKSGSRTQASKGAEGKEEFELRSLPDGIQYRVKVGDKKKTARRFPIRRRGRDDAGPGPAIVDVLPETVVGRRPPGRIDLGDIVRETRRPAAFLKRNLPVSPKVAVVLGSGLSAAADLAPGDPLEFSDIPGFKVPRAPGHPGLVRAGLVDGVSTVFLEGRLHFYETGSMKDVAFPIYSLLSIGVEHVILTTSAGALNPSYRAGDVMFVEDHINLMGGNPMVGLDPTARPPVFVSGDSIYDKFTIDMSERLLRRARARGSVGVLAGVRGPVYETPAERKWLRSMGADAVCMSVIPEALAAARAGAAVTALAVIANESGPGRGEALTHEDVTRAGERAAEGLARLLRSVITEER
ncbi:MAG: purine-nucleoside phosphorylase [Candidatus Nitrospinota bacterium M3_3B_026]